MGRRSLLAAATTSAALVPVVAHSVAQVREQPLPSWNDGPAKQAILDFVRTLGQVPPEDRIATFDQDGTLWVEHPVYTQAMFALERVHTLASQHPQWKDQEPFKSVLAGDEAAIAKFSERDWAEIIFATHAGMSQAEFQDIVRQWLASPAKAQSLIACTLVAAVPYAGGWNSYRRSSALRITAAA